MRHFACLLIGLFVLQGGLRGQVARDSAAYLVRLAGFYNLENLFDTRDDSLAFDEAFTPEGKDRWTSERLETKLRNLSRVLLDMGREYGASPPDLLGVCEVENRYLLERLVQLPAMAPYSYGFIHFNSPDPRGIDVALLYRKDRFFPLEERSFRLLLYNASGARKFTRDQLVVSGYLDQDLVHILVNHWPSRGGGAQSREYRKVAALRQRSLIDSIAYRHPGSKIISMGDFNDNPSDPSLKILSRNGGAGGHRTKKPLLNPLAGYHKKGMGSLAYRDRWNLFDQILLSPAWLDPEPGTYRFWKAGIFQAGYLKNREGKYRGYPLRTYAGGRYQGGFSDHFPVYVLLIRPAKGGR